MNFFKNFLARRRIRETAREFADALGKQLRYKKDLLPADTLVQLSGFEASLRGAVKQQRDEELPGLLNKGDRLVTKLLPMDSLDWLREQVEVILVAVVTALAVRAYFYQPFKIPTDSMKPTLYGVATVHDQQEPPSWIQQRWEQLVFGRLYHSIHLQSEATLNGMQECDLSVLKIWFDYTDLSFSNGETHRVWCSPTDLAKAGIYANQTFAPNDPQLRFHTDAGDQVLVNKWLFNFRLPHRGEVLVFRTSNIEGIQYRLRMQGIEGSEFYIKRCVGLPGDTLSVQSPLLLINGGTALENAAIRRVESARDGYRGYGIEPGHTNPIYLRTPEDTYTVPPNGFWAMGDNSYDSLDSRYWGPVPRENIVGTGTLVWWPFSRRWGGIR